MANWESYRYLVKLGECGSLSAAARSLSVSQPTVRRRLADLETDLGVELLDRTRDGHRLSQAGVRIYAQARQLAERAELIELSARGADGETLKRLRLGASEGIAFAILTPVIARLRQLHADVAIDLAISNTPIDLTIGDADIALRLGAPQDERLFGQRVGTARFGLYGGENYLAQAPPVDHPDVLAQHMIIESTGDIANLPQAILLRQLAPESHIGYSANSLLNQMCALSHGMGLLSLPDYLAADLGGIRRVLSDDFDLTLDVWLLTNEQVRRNKQARATIDLVAKEVRSHLRRLDRN